MNDETPQNHKNDEEKINYNTPEYGYGNTSELPRKTDSNSSEEKNQLKLFRNEEDMKIFERKKLTNDGKISNAHEYFFRLEKNPALQFIISELASLVMPVAPILYDGENFYSKYVKNHKAYTSAENVETQDELNLLFLYLIFRDNDHGKGTGRRSNKLNYDNHVFYDFHRAEKYGNFPSEYQKIYNNTYFIFNDEDDEFINLMKEKVNKFMEQIDGEDGLKFIDAVIKKANATNEIDAKKIHDTYLKRCKSVTEGLDYILACRKPLQ